MIINIFCEVFFGWLWKSHVAIIYKNPSLYQECLQRILLLRTLSRHLQSTSITPLILGDSAYPLEEFILKPHADFGDSNPNWKEIMLQ